MGKKIKRARQLREGFTTGTAAAAAAQAAVIRLLGGSAPDTLDVALPPFVVQNIIMGVQGNHSPAGVWGGAPIHLRLPINIAETGTEPDGSAWAAVIKDGGDDPDATHGARIIVHAAKKPWVSAETHAATRQDSGQGSIHLYGGAGVGLVTLPGLPVTPGGPAINPEPRKQIAFAALEAAARYGYSGSLHLLISVPDGAERAKKTMNARLGITGGISILGTRGTVRPYGHDAWKATISQGISVAASLRLDTLLFSTGRRSERLGFGLYPDLAPQCGIQVTDFAGFAIRETAKYNFARIIWCCFPGKLLKLAQGLEWTHASIAAADLSLLTRHCAEAGGSDELLAALATVPTATGMFTLMERTPAVHDAALRRIGKEALAALQGWLNEAGSCCPKLTLCVFSLRETLLLRLP